MQPTSQIDIGFDSSQNMKGIFKETLQMPSKMSEINISGMNSDTTARRESDSGFQQANIYEHCTTDNKDADIMKLLVGEQ